MNILKNKEKNYKNLLVVILVLNIIYFFYGFINQHDFSNGGKIDFDHIYNNFLLFKNNSLSEINWKNYESSSLPLHYLTTKYIIPSDNIFAFKLYTFLISLLCIIPLYQILKLKTNTLNLNINFLFLSSIIFISSSFRTDAFFGLEENIGYLLFLLTFLIFLYYLEKKNNNYLFFLIFIASLTFYSRQTYAFVSIAQTDKRTDYPGKEEAQKAVNFYLNQTQVTGDLSFVKGNEWDAGNISYHLEVRPKWIYNPGSIFLCNKNLECIKYK